jgi:uncharacterized membrane protein HdeD (DUF308 family)
VHWAELCLQWVFTSEVKLDKSQHRTRRWNVIGSGLLCAAFAVVVLYTSPRAFFSPLAMVVVAAIGLAAVLLQLRVRRDGNRPVRGPVLLNLLGILLAVTALFADVLHLSSGLFQVAALAAVGCFSISSVIILETLRKHRAVPK